MNWLPLLLAGITACLSAAPGPDLVQGGPEPADLNFNLGLRDGEQEDDFLRGVKHLYYNLEGKGAVRDGLRHQERTILDKQRGRADPAQSALLNVTLRADAAIVKVYRTLRENARGVRRAWNLALTEPGSPAALDALAGAEAGLALTKAELPALRAAIEHAAAWHEFSHRAAGGSKRANPTQRALLNASATATAAVERGEAALAKAREFSALAPPPGVKRADQNDALPELEDFPLRIQLDESAGSFASLPKSRREGVKLRDLKLRRDYGFFDGRAAAR